MKKKIKKYGNAHIILLSPEDLELNGLEVGDVIDFTITKITKPKKK